MARARQYTNSTCLDHIYDQGWALIPCLNVDNTDMAYFRQTQFIVNG